jgi:hypothetical protein
MRYFIAACDGFLNEHPWKYAKLLNNKLHVKSWNSAKEECKDDYDV